jgi:hypothetical protein
MSRMQEQRYELKYWLDAQTALRVREHVQQHLMLDPFSVGKPDLSYPVHSLYLDAEDLPLYRGTLEGWKNRFKLRLRYYDEKPASPCFFEIKRRVKDVILKERGGVRKRWVPHLLAGHLCEREHLLDPDSDADWFAVQRFQELMLQLQTRPMLHVAYMREAYEKEGDNSVRVTFDRAVHTAPNPGGLLRIKSEDPCDVFGKTVILELKFTDRYPNWFNELVQHFDCWLTGAAKYVGGIEQRGTRWARKLPMPTWLTPMNYPSGPTPTR